MGKKASDIVRILSATFTTGRKIVSLTEETHKSVLLGLINILTSSPGNTSAVASRETVMAFLATRNVEKFPNTIIFVTDEVKTVECNGETLLALLSAWGNVKAGWNVDRGGSRENANKEQPATLGELS